ncbi:hypothetical protein QWJ26_30010 [Streptomyces sp. CSDS2]|uniref:hypothetical protein n=1 Tax=Streptomyces sp. CSDS2 TaxID=3055051 RepID=UPI0025AF602A|nr:hypothetical protein [Streptomyces sp. CSDS2]MDN3263972.1 hypothetical protein [Streptomyces sp. CSDS2]
MITFPLSPEQRTVYWTVAVCDTYGSVHRTTGLHSASAVRRQHDYWSAKQSTARTELTEHTLVQTRTVTAFEALPGLDEPTPLPDLPAGAQEVKRFFTFARALEDGSLTGFGPAVLPAGDDVRHFYEWTVKNQERAQAVRVDVSTLRILDITLTHYTRELQLADLPDDDATSLVGQLETAGLYWVPVHENAGTCLRVPLADGSQIPSAARPTAGKNPAPRPHSAIVAAGSLCGTTSMAFASRSTALCARTWPVPRTPQPWRPSSSTAPARTAAVPSSRTNPNGRPHADSPWVPDLPSFRRPGAATPGRRPHRLDSRRRQQCCAMHRFSRRTS